MPPIPPELNPPARILLGPGPSDVHPRVLRAMTTPIIGHLDPAFAAIMGDVRAMLQQVFQTRNGLTFPVSATGMAGMEACVVNLIEPGDRMIVCASGIFGYRMADVAERAGAAVALREKPFGQVFELDELRTALKRVRPKVLGIVHAETSTGARQPLEALGKLCHEFDTLLLADCVTSLGCIPVETDAWEIDAAFSCSQKGLSCPPGMAPITFSSKALEAVARRKRKVQSWYLDLGQVQRYWSEERFYHHTGPITMVYGLYEALRIVLEEGLSARFARHQLHHRALKAGLTALGLRFLAAESHQLPQLNAVHVPEGVDDLAVRRRMLDEYGIEIGGGLGELKGKLWRIGLMGHGCRANNVLLCLSALEQCLVSASGARRPEPGVAVAAAERVYAER